MKRTAKDKPEGKKSGIQKRNRAGVSPQRPKPTKDAPFGVDVSEDGDIATPKRDLSEDEIKEQEDRRS